MLNFSRSLVDQLYSDGVQHHLAGRAAEAEQIYRQILAQAPDHADTWHMLGVLICQKGQRQPAIEMMARAVALEPLDGAVLADLTGRLGVDGIVALVRTSATGASL